MKGQLHKCIALMMISAEGTELSTKPVRLLNKRKFNKIKGLLEECNSIGKSILVLIK